MLSKELFFFFSFFIATNTGWNSTSVHSAIVYLVYNMRGKTPAHYECYLDAMMQVIMIIPADTKGVLSASWKGELFLGAKIHWSPYSHCQSVSWGLCRPRSIYQESSVLISILALIDGVEVEKSIAHGQMNNPTTARLEFLSCNYPLAFLALRTSVVGNHIQIMIFYEDSTLTDCCRPRETQKSFYVVAFSSFCKQEGLFEKKLYS